MRLSIIAIALALVACPVQAQDAARRLELADRYLELQMGEGVMRTVEAQIKEQYAQSDLSEEESRWLTRQFTQVLETVMRQTMADIRDDVAETYTEEELSTVIAFLETPVGASVNRKDIQLGMVMQEAMMPHMVAAVTDLSAKYCERFECEEPSPSAAKRN